MLLPLFEWLRELGMPGAAVMEGFVELLYPDSPRHPKQKYRLTEKGKSLLK